jgi:hypothetical protein
MKRIGRGRKIAIMGPRLSGESEDIASTASILGNLGGVLLAAASTIKL